MNRIRCIRRIATVLGGLAAALLVLAAASPAMAATARVPHYGPSMPPPQVPAQIRTVVTGGMPGWQITLIAVGAALAAAAIAVLLDRALTSRRHVVQKAA